MNILKHKDYVPYKESVIFEGFRAIGYFPYERARVRCAYDGARPPRALYAEIEQTIQMHPAGRMDNKAVVLFEDDCQFGTSSFAIFFHDLSATLGTWDDVCSYDGKELTPLD
jgi:hypothetical protein